MIRRMLGAVQFLTVIPVRMRTATPGESALFFPLVGAALGAAGGLALEWARGYVPFTLACLLVLACWTVLTGGLHEDGFADVADAFRSWRSREKILDILKDSRVGAHGAVALILLLLIRWQALSSIAAEPVVALAAALALGRAAVVVLVWITPAVGDGGAARLSATLSTSVAILVLVQGLAFALMTDGRLPSVLLGGTTAITLLARGYFIGRIGGVTGDCLGTVEQLVETWCLIVFTCRPCI